MGLPTYHTSLLEFDGMVNLMKGAIETADRITTVSPTYAKELLDPWYSYGMDRALVRRQDGIVGILNGIDVIGYDPETELFCYQNGWQKRMLCSPAERVRAD